MQQISLASPEVYWAVRPATVVGTPDQVTAAFAGGATIPAQVPGCAHDDLLAASLIPDPYLGTDERTDSWIGHHAWHYETTLPAMPAGFERYDLVADGLDTVARLAVNGCTVGSTRNQHRNYRFDVTRLLPKATSVTPHARLTVDFADIYGEAERVRGQVGDYPASYDEPFNYVRKMASNFGWDWGPTVVTAGVWRDIRIEAWNTARLAQVRPHVSLDSATGEHGTVRVDIQVERTAAGLATPLALTARLLDPSGAVVAETGIGMRAEATNAEVDLDAGTVQRWWPWNMGAQPMYRLEVTLSAGDVLSDWSARIGFRSIELATPDDADGRGFTFVVAGRPVFATGFDWIPNDLLVHRVTAADYRARLRDAKDAGATLIRVWGGGIFEKDEFYEACDELGLMVWQDCLFACAAYPETPDFEAEVRAEVRDNAVRLMPHPSLALWNGCNENIWGFADWGWVPQLDGRGWGGKYYFEVLPEVLKAIDPGRSYWPGSPYSGDRRRHPNDPDFGCNHSWEVWNRLDYTHYLDEKPRFVAEFGWCGPAAYSTMRDAVGEPHMRAWDPVYMWHYKSGEGEPKLRRAIADGFSDPVDFDTWHYAAQVQQARAVRFGIDWWRADWPHCSGAVVWQLNDCWAVTSWAAVDSAGVRKPSWYAIREAFAPCDAVIFPADGCYRLSLSNRGDTDWYAQPLVRRVDLAGVERARWEHMVKVPAGEVVQVDLPTDVVPAPTGTGADAWATGLDRDEIVVVDAYAGPGATSRRVLARPDKQLNYPTPRYRVDVTPSADGGRVIVTAETVVRDLLLQADRLGANASHELVTLLPGESYAWHVNGLGRALTRADCAAPVLLCAADVETRAKP